MERTFTLDRNLMLRAERKLRRHGRTLDDAVTYAMTVIVSTRGLPQMESATDPFFNEPNTSHLRNAIADMNAGRNVVFRDIVEDSGDAWRHT